MTTDLQLKGLSKKNFAQLARKAKRLGMSTEEYLRELVEEDLALDRKAQTTTFAELVGPGREIDEDELDRLVKDVRASRRNRAGRKR